MINNSSSLIQFTINVPLLTHAVMEEFVRLLNGSINVTAPVQITMDHSVKQVQNGKRVFPILYWISLITGIRWIQLELITQT